MDNQERRVPAGTRGPPSARHVIAFWWSQSSPPSDRGPEPAPDQPDRISNHPLDRAIFNPPDHASNHLPDQAIAQPSGQPTGFPSGPAAEPSTDQPSQSSSNVNAIVNINANVDANTATDTTLGPVSTDSFFPPANYFPTHQTADPRVNAAPATAATPRPIGGFPGAGAPPIWERYLAADIVPDLTAPMSQPQPPQFRQRRHHHQRQRQHQHQHAHTEADADWPALLRGLILRGPAYERMALMGLGTRRRRFSRAQITLEYNATLSRRDVAAWCSNSMMEELCGIAHRVATGETTPWEEQGRWEEFMRVLEEGEVQGRGPGNGFKEEEMGDDEPMLGS